MGHIAGHVASENPSVVYYNPAALTLGQGTHIYAEGIFAYRTFDYTRDPGAISHPLADGENGGGTPASATEANSGEAHLSDLIASPFLGVTSDLGIDRLGVGLAAYVPYGGSAKWDQNPAYEGNQTYPGAVDGPARWATIEGEQRLLYLTAAGSYEVLPNKLSLGLALSVISSEINLIRARNPNGSDDLVVVSPTGTTVTEGRSLLEAKSTTFGAAVGVLYSPTPEWHIGLSYTSQPGFGEMSMKGTLTNKFGALPTAAVDIDLRQSLPDVWRLGAAYQMSRDAEIHVMADFQRWSVFDNQCLLDADNPNAKCAFDSNGGVDTAAGGEGVIVNIPRNYDNAFGVRVGGSYYVTPCIALQGGVDYDSNAIPDETIDPALADADKVTVAVGADIGISGGFSVVAGISHASYFERTTAPRAVEPTAPSLNPDMAGRYEVAVTFASLGLGYVF